jgi:hypothetical protein
MCLLMLVLAAGCNSGHKTVGLRGEVTFDGRAVEKGRIDFLPVEGTAGGSTGDAITNGQYDVPTKGGLLPDGIYVVRITALKKTGQTTVIPKMGGVPMELEENFIPASYNSQSILKIRVRDLPDTNKVDFRLGKTPAAAPSPR